mgnify:CR=1 FL=1
MMSFGADSFGIGESIGAMHSARAVEGCGQQPTCSFASNCESKIEAFNNFLFVAAMEG